MLSKLLSFRYLFSPLFALYLSAGCLVALSPVLGWMIAGFGSALFVGCALRNRWPEVGVWAILLVVVFGFGYLRASSVTFKISGPSFEHSSVVQLQGRIVSSPVQKTRSYQAKIQSLETGQLYLMSWRPQSVPVTPKYGEIVHVSGRFYRPQPQRNPGGWDAPRYYLTKGLSGKLLADQIRATGTTRYNYLQLGANWLKSKIIALHNTTVKPPLSSLYTALIFGDAGLSLDEKLKAQFQDLGLTHLLVVSGSQVALLSGIILAILRALSVRGLRLFLGVGVGNIVFYVLTGGGASIFRAVISFMIMLGLSLTHRRSTPYHVISVTIAIMLMINPLYILDVGAYLSFLATFSLIYAAPIIQNRLPSGWPTWLKSGLSVTLAPFLWTTPLLWALFNQVSIVSLLSNFLVVSAIEILVVIGFFSTMAGLVFLTGALLADQVSWAIMAALVKLAEWLSKIPYGRVYLKSPPLWVVFLLYLTMLFIFEAVANQRRRQLRYLGGIVSFCFVVAACVSLLPQPLRVVFLDVDQGDATLIILPNDKTILIDTGNSKKDFRTGKPLWNAAESVILPALKSYGINKLDMMVITHFDQDHVGGAPILLKEIPIGTVVDNGHYTNRYSGYLAQVDANARSHWVAKPQQFFPARDVSLEFLYPSPAIPPAESKNNNSVVVKLSYKDIDFLFPGDLEAERELWLTGYYGSKLDVEVLKLGHHGSKTSTIPQFLNATTPQLAIISCGQKNRYGHPSKEVLVRLNSLDIPVLRTDQSGAIEVWTDGGTLKWRSFLP